MLKIVVFIASLIPLSEQQNICTGKIFGECMPDPQSLNGLTYCSTDFQPTNASNLVMCVPNVPGFDVPVCCEVPQKYSTCQDDFGTANCSQLAKPNVTQACASAPPDFRQQCALTCNNCDAYLSGNSGNSTTNTTCIDGSGIRCIEWNKHGYCDNTFYSQEEKQKTCAKTCGLCASTSNSTCVDIAPTCQQYLNLCHLTTPDYESIMREV
uniref:ShKT domain-containing protein n=1 Tax=Acrobeloides nanus TaxID=290746 RepID=A0A914CZI0_9BILA